jgi:hypothetical protein
LFGAVNLTSHIPSPEAADGGHSRGVAPAKWFGTLNDQRIPLPQRVVKVSVLRAQAGVPADQVIVRDHNSPDDEVLDDNGQVDLGKGNVFYTEPRCDAGQPAPCNTAAKLALSVDDRVEETLNHSQTGTTVLDLFGLDRDRALYRDYESPNDAIIKPDDPVRFVDGPVFYTRAPAPHTGLKIFVNHRSFTKEQGVKPLMTPREIASLVTSSPDEFDTYAGPVAQGTPLPPNEKIHVKDCDVFTVVKREVTGGYLATRVEAELATLRQGGASVDLLPEPAAVIYRKVPAREGLGANASDVLVQVPSGYPGNQIDGAYLPAGSPFLTRVVGQVTGTTITADGRTWHLVSYHPHAGGGFPTWNPNLHGFHTYIDALIAWLARWK